MHRMQEDAHHLCIHACMRGLHVRSFVSARRAFCHFFGFNLFLD